MTALGLLNIMATAGSWRGGTAGIPATAHAIMFERDRQLRFLQQRQKGFLQNILGFTAAQTRRAAIKNQLRGFLRVQIFTPIAHHFIT